MALFESHRTRLRTNTVLRENKQGNSMQTLRDGEGKEHQTHYQYLSMQYGMYSCSQADKHRTKKGSRQTCVMEKTVCLGRLYETKSK